MTPVSAAHRGDISGVARRGEPVVDRSADAPAFDRRVARAVVAGDQKQHAVAGKNRLLEPAVDRLPGGVEGQAVKIERPVGLDRAGAQAPVPAAVEGGSGFGLGRNPLGYARRYFVGNCRRFRW